MKTPRFALLILGVLGLACAAAEAREDKVKVDKDKLVGVWEVAKSELPRGTVLTFTGDGKVRLVFNPKGDDPVPLEGTYAIEGDGLRVVMLIDGKEVKDTLRVLKLSDTDLVFKDDKNVVDEWKRRKPAKQ